MSKPPSTEASPINLIRRISVGGAAPADGDLAKPESAVSVSPATSRGKEVSHLVAMVEDLQAITTVTNDVNLLISRYMDAVSQRASLLALAWFEIPDNAQPNLVESRFKNTLMDTPAISQQLHDAAESSAANQKPQVFKSDAVRGSLIACVPFFKDDNSNAVVCGILHDDRSKCAEAVMACQSIANHYNLWRSRDQLTTMSMEVRSTATVLELVGKTECSVTTKDACIKIANEIQQHFRCDCVAVGIKHSQLATCRLMAMSSTAEFDYQSRTTTLVQNSFNETIVNGSFTAFPPTPQSKPALAQRKLAQHMRAESAIGIPLRNQDETVIGAITIIGNRELGRNPATRNLIRALEHPLGSCLDLVRVAEGGPLRKLKRKLLSSNHVKAKWVALLAVIIAVAAMFIPVSYRINSPCTVEPVIRRFSVAPHDGLLENTFVEPGDLVESNQILAKMDGRELGIKISQAIADKNRAAKDHDLKLAKGEISEAIQADLARQGFEAELKVLQQKQENLEIKSAIGGVVLSGSIDRRENYPVTLGQTLYEVAPVSPLRVELAIASDEIMHVEPGQTVKFRFDGFGTETMMGKVERIRPSSTIRDEQNVFIAEVLLENRDGQVRPGMEGFARVYGTKRTLGWAIFHRPWEKFVSAIGF